MPFVNLTTRLALQTSTCLITYYPTIRTFIKLGEWLPTLFNIYVAPSEEYKLPTVFHTGVPGIGYISFACNTYFARGIDVLAAFITGGLPAAALTLICIGWSILAEAKMKAKEEGLTGDALKESSSTVWCYTIFSEFVTSNVARLASTVLWPLHKLLSCLGVTSNTHTEWMHNSFQSAIELLFDYGPEVFYPLSQYYMKALPDFNFSACASSLLYQPLQFSIATFLPALAYGVDEEATSHAKFIYNSALTAIFVALSWNERYEYLASQERNPSTSTQKPSERVL